MASTLVESSHTTHTNFSYKIQFTKRSQVIHLTTNTTSLEGIGMKKKSNIVDNSFNNDDTNTCTQKGISRRLKTIHTKLRNNKLRAYKS